MECDSQVKISQPLDHRERLEAKFGRLEFPYYEVPIIKQERLLHDAIHKVFDRGFPAHSLHLWRRVKF